MPQSKDNLMNDPATAATLARQEKIKNVVESEGWKIIKEDLGKDLTDVDSITGLGDLSKMTPDEFYRIAAIRQGAIDLIFKWIKKVEGNSSQFTSNMQAMKKVREGGDIINREEDSREESSPS